MKKIFLSLFFFNVFMLSFSQNDGKNSFGTPSSSPVRIAFYENENFQIGAEEGEIKAGYAYEYYRKIASLTGWKFEYIYGDWNFCYNALLEGEADLLAGLAFSKERAKFLNYPELPMGHEKYVVYKKKGSELISENKKSLAGKTIGTLSGAMEEVLSEWLKENNIDAKIRVFGDIAKRDEALVSEEIQAMIGESTGVNGEFDAVYSIKGVSYYIVTAKNRTDLLEKLNDAQRRLYENDPFYEDYLQNKYFKQTSYTKTLFSEEKKWLSENKKITVGYKDNFLPFCDADERGNVNGIIKDIFPALLRTVGIKDELEINYAAYNDYRKMIDDLHKGKIDVIFPVETDIAFGEREEIYQTKALFQGSANLVYKGNYTDLIVKKIAVSRGMGLVENFARRNYKDVEMVYTDSVFESLDAVSEGRADGTILEGLTTSGNLSKKNDPNLHYVKCRDIFDFSMGVSEENVELLRLLDHCIGNLDDHLFLELSYKYTENFYNASIVDFVREHIGLVIIVFLVIILAVTLAFLMYIRAKVREKKAADLANKAKTSFLFNMSHDIRTPLNAIIGFAELADKHYDNKEKLTDYLKKIISSGGILLSILNNVLEMARIEKGTVVVDNQPCDSYQLFESIYAVFEEAIKNKGIKVEKRFTVKNKYIYCDSVKIREIYMNIVSNAIKYTMPGGTITLLVEEIPVKEEGMTSLKATVADTGIGISKEFLSKIFDEFSREKNSEKNIIEGTGLGMSITKRFVDILGGKIEVSSEVGKGTTVSFTIPHKIAREEEILAENRSGKETDNFEGIRILLAEDNDLNAEITMEILSERGFKVERAEDGRDCVRKVSEKEAGYYALVLMDIQMPYLNGYEATKEIRNLEDPEKAGIPIVAVTANAFEEDKRDAFAAGMNGHLAKPIDINQFVNVVSDVIANSKK